MAGQGVAARNLTLRSHFGADRHPTLSLPTLYVALFRGDPSAGGAEPGAAGGYTRIAKPNDATLWGTIAATDTLVSNKGSAGAIVWPAATGLYTVTDPLNWWGMLDNAAGGVLWYWGLLSTPIKVTGAGDIPRLPVGTLVCNQPV